MKTILFICFSLITTGLAYSQIQTINVGTSANDHTGDPLRTVFGKVNSNFVYIDGRIDDVVDRIDSLFDAGFNDAVTAARLDSLIDAGVAGAWGTITGTLSAQTDLQSALDLKVPTSRTINSQALSGDITLTKSNIGLSNVDNTSDASKPVSTATQTALDAKQSTLTNSAGLASALSDESGTGTVVFSSVTDGKQSTLTNSAGLASALSDESGTGTVVFSSITDAKITNPMTTAGDIIIGGASGTPTRLAAGASAGHVLTSNGSGVAPSWQAASGGSVTQTITNGVTTTSPSEDVLFDALALKAERTREYGVACSDLTTALTTGTSKAYFRIPRGFTITAVRASVLTAQSSGSILTIDINESGTTILSTKLTIDNSEKTSTTAATAPVVSDASLADDAEITIDIDQVGTSPAGLIVWIIGY